MSLVRDDIALRYASDGYVVLRGAIQHESIDAMRRHLCELVESVGGPMFRTPHSPEFARFMNDRKDLQTRVYDAIRKPSWLLDFSMAPGLVESARHLLGGGPIATLRKIPFRIDAPLETSQFAVWHQDYFYVRGNPDIITAWVPLQKTTYFHGCPSVMPGSHKLGPLPHVHTVIGKRHCPDGIFDREIRLVEVEEGDAILFHSCLLHSSGLNVSDVTRFSIQARYTRANEPTDPGMGGIVTL